MSASLRPPAQHRLFHPAQGVLVAPGAERPHREDPHLAVVVVQGSFQLGHRPGRGDRGEGPDGGQPEVPLGMRQGLAQAGHGALQLEPAAEIHDGRQRLGVGQPEEPHDFGGAGIGQPLRRADQEVPDRLVPEPGQPDQDGLQRGGTQLAEQLAEVIRVRGGGGFVHRLEQLGQYDRLAQLGPEGIQPFAVLRGEIPSPLAGGPQFPERHRHLAEFPRVEQVGDHHLEDAQDLVPDRRLGLQLQQIEQDVQGRPAQVPGVFLVQRPGEVLDLPLVEEVERRSKSSMSTIPLRACSCAVPDLASCTSSAACSLISSGTAAHHRVPAVRRRGQLRGTPRRR